MSALTLLNAVGGEILPDRRVALAFLGCRGREPDPVLKDLLEKASARLLPRLTYRACALRLPLTLRSDCVWAGDLPLPGTALAKHLAGCGEVLLFAATIGTEADRLLALLARTAPAEAAVADALASAAIEAWCDEIEARLTGSLPHRSRFSPGYGDLPLSVQPEILNRLDAGRKIGLWLTDSLLLTPVKSVTAVIGIEPCP